MTPDDKSIIAVDFDRTLAFGKWPETKDPNEHLMKWLIQQRIKGNKVILWTNRSGDPLDAAIRFCRIYGLEFDAVNENLPEMIEAYGNDSRKVSADYYIDDRSYHPKDEDWEYLHLHKRDLERKE